MNMKRCTARQLITGIVALVSSVHFSSSLPNQIQAPRKPTKLSVVASKSEDKKTLSLPKQAPKAAKASAPVETAKPTQAPEAVDQIEVFKRKKHEKEQSEREQQKKLHDSALAYSQECHNNQDLFDFRFCQDAEPIVNLLKTAHKVDLRIDSLYCAMRILVNSSKSCEYVRDCSLNSILESLELYGTDYFESDEGVLTKKKAYKAVEKTVYDFVSDGSDLALSSPGTFASSLSSKVVKVASKNLRPSQKKEWQDRLRSLVLRMLESSISKTLWDSQDHQGIWDSVMTTANGLYQLSKVLEHMDDLDDLYWSLCRRLVWFFDFSAGHLPLSFYEGVEESIRDGSAFFLELPEQDEGITTKKELLLEAVKKAKAKAIQPEFFVSDQAPQLSLSKSDSEIPTPLIQPLESLFEPEVPTKSTTLAKSQGKRASSAKA